MNTETDLEKRIWRLELLHIWGGALLAVIIIGYIIKTRNASPASIGAISPTPTI